MNCKNGTKFFEMNQLLSAIVVCILQLLVCLIQTKSETLEIFAPVTKFVSIN